MTVFAYPAKNRVFQARNICGRPVDAHSRSHASDPLYRRSASGLTLVSANVNSRLVLFMQTHRARPPPAAEMILPPTYMNIQDTNPIHHVLSAPLFATQIAIETNIILQREVGAMIIQDPRIKPKCPECGSENVQSRAVLYQYRRMGGEDSGSPDG